MRNPQGEIPLMEADRRSTRRWACRRPDKDEGPATALFCTFLHFFSSFCTGFPARARNWGPRDHGLLPTDDGPVEKEMLPDEIGTAISRAEEGVRFMGSDC